MFVWGSNELLVEGTGLAGFIVLIFVNLGIYLHRRGFREKVNKERM